MRNRCVEHRHAGRTEGNEEIRKRKTRPCKTKPAGMGHPTEKDKVKIFSASRGCSTCPQVIYAIKCGATKLTNSRAYTVFVAFQYFGKWRKFPVTR
jgi:hypothetical protein